MIHTLTANAPPVMSFRDSRPQRDKVILDRRIILVSNMRCPNCESQLSPHAKQCDRCGEDIPASQHLLEESGAVEPGSEIATTNQTAGTARNYRFARFGDRFVAFAADTAVLFGMFAIADAWAIMRWGTFEGVELQLTTASLLMAIGLNAAILFLYGWLLEAGCGATLGKALVGIRVVGSEGRGIFSSCAIRNALRIVDGLGFYLVGFLVAACSGIRQRTGDIYAQTAVIEESFGMGIRVTALVVFIVTLAGAGWAVPRICSVDRSVHPRHLNQIIARVGKTSNSAYLRVAHLSIDVQTSPVP